MVRMLAHHPISGQPIRILRTETQISSDLKTLVWIRKSFQPSHRWARWFCLVTEPEALKLCSPSVVILSLQSDLDAWLPLLHTLSDTECLFFAPNKIIIALQSRGFNSQRVIVWEDMFDCYPYIGEPIVANDSLEKVIVGVAHILRMNRIVWSVNKARDEMAFGLRAQLDAWAKQCAGVLHIVPLESDDSCIPQTWLIQQYFKPTSNRRAREINNCLAKNIESPWIDHILLLNEQEEPSLPTSNKLRRILLGHRLTYLDVFDAILNEVPKGAFVIFANSDIWFNESLVYLWRIQLLERRMCLALLRWEDDPAGKHIFGPRSDSQDTWIVARDAIDFTPTDDDFGFPFGKSGCDNAIALVMMRKKFLVVNPAYSIQTFHLHTSNIRTYDPKDVLYRTHYLYIDPTHIQVCAIRTNLDTTLPEAVSKAWTNQPFGKSFLRPIHSVQDTYVQSLCDVLKKYVPNDQNLFTPVTHSAPLYNFHDVFVTKEGLISKCNEIYVGKHPLWVNLWESVKQSSLTQSIHVPNMISIPWPTQQPFNRWILHYLPKALMIRELVQSAGLHIPEFLIPNDSDVGAFLDDCIWPQGGKTVVPMMENINYYSNNVWSMPPVEEQTPITREDIQRLRALMPPAESTTGQPVIVFCVEDSDTQICTRFWAEEVANTVLPKGWIVRYLSASDTPSTRRKALRDAAWMVGSGPALEWLWYLPAGATVLEYISDTKPDGYTIHLAGAAEVRYVLGLFTNEPIHVQRQTALLNVGIALRKFGFKEMIQEIRSRNNVMPQIIVPSGKGLHGIWNHCGDTFREMVDIWADRNYIQRVKSEGTGFCWWGGIGEILLYDRPTARWWANLPSYQMALFGNCPPPGPPNHLLRQSVWCFWPRSPKAIEDIVNRLETVRSYESRPIASLFIGKVENGVQHTHRLQSDWSKSVELFSMPIDTTGQPYPYSQSEYLEKLCKARFGLCLPGFGHKCNREIEYFACGCVPIVTDGVDMKYYLVPPREGIHYFKAKTPEDVVRIVQTTSVEKWTAMSLAGREWWSTFASAEGLFRLTWARIEQCRPYLQVGIPPSFPLA